MCHDPSAWARRAHDIAHAERMSQRAPLPSLRGHPQSWDNPLSSRIKPRLPPGLTESCAAELDPIMQLERPILPELHDQGQEAVAGPIRRSRNGTSHEFRSVERNRPLEGVAARAERTAGPGADLSTGGRLLPRDCRERTRPAHPDSSDSKASDLWRATPSIRTYQISEATGLSPAFLQHVPIIVVHSLHA